ncbi:MAG: glycoside hydrolase family 130 protein [Micromonosporaceae bacterium]|nr:glycoside hydrolase family 130 protein [Micromonosporaceae bacterium]
MTGVKIIGAPLANMPWQPKPQGQAGPVWRHDGNPIIGWNPTKKTARVFNSAVLPHGDSFIGVFRADHKHGRPMLHVGRSKDALNWDIEDEEIQWRDEKGVSYQPNYAYDPRLVKLEDAFYIVWCTEFGGPALGLGRTTDFKSFTRLENITSPFNRNGVPFPRKVNDKYLMLNRPSDSGHTPFGDIYLCESPDLVHWGRHRRVMKVSGPSWWQGLKIGGGAVPIETSEGWLLFYHGVSGTCNGFVYGFGAALLDLDQPSKVLYRTDDYLLTPEEPYETTGFVPNVAFPCATLHDAETGRIAIYYGAADTYVAVAYTQIDELVEHIKASSVLVPGDDEDYR